MNQEKKTELSNLSNDDIENIVTIAFTKEIQSPEFQNDYTPALRLKVLQTHYLIVKMIQSKQINTSI